MQSTPVTANQPTPASLQSKRVTFFGTNVHILTLNETLERAEEAMRGNKLTRHTALNVAKLINMRADKELAHDVNTSDLVGIDGKGIAYGLKIFGEKSATRVAGIDLFYALLERCAQTGRKPFILGARQEQLQTAIDNAKARYPGLQFAGWRNGYFNHDDHDQVVDQIATSGADCLFVAMPTPHKERFLNAHCEKLNVPFIMGVGGSVDVLAGHVSRAPMWMQNAGLEWFHRLIKEPRKMTWRYTRTNSLYMALLARTMLSGRNPVQRG